MGSIGVRLMLSRSCGWVIYRLFFGCDVTLLFLFVVFSCFHFSKSLFYIKEKLCNFNRDFFFVLINVIM